MKGLDQKEKAHNHKVVEIRRVCKVGKGGKTLRFRALVVVGNQQGVVGIGIGKANQVLNAIRKGQYRAIQNRIQIPLTRTKTIPHQIKGSYGASLILLRPAAPGSGVIAGGAIRAVLELAGIRNILAKQINSKNKVNTAKATLSALENLRYLTVTAKLRKLTLERLTNRKPKISSNMDEKSTQAILITNKLAEKPSKKKPQNKPKDNNK